MFTFLNCIQTLLLYVACYQKLQEDERRAVAHRVTTSRQLMQEAESAEAVLQTRYAKLNKMIQEYQLQNTTKV